MGVKIIHARINEKGEIIGGQLGDQTGTEVVKQDFYEDSWHTVYRPKKSTVAKKMVQGAEKIAKNNHFGYDQGTRYTGFEESKKLNYEFDKVTKDCSFDCSSMIMTLIASNGISVKKEFFTWNMDGIMKGLTDHFEKITYKKGMALKAGDILLKTGHVVLIVETDAYTVWVGECYGAKTVPVYTEPKTTATRCSWPTLGTGNLFDVYGEQGDWYYIRIANVHFGWIKKQYVLRKTVKYTGKVVSGVHVRTNAGALYTSLGTLNNGETVKICDVKKSLTGVDWYYIIYKNGYGFSSSKYITNIKEV